MTYLDVLSILVLGGFTEQGPADDAVGVKLPEHLIGHHAGHAGEKDEFVVLVEVAEEVVDTRTLGHTPSMLTAPLAVHQEVLQTQHKSVRLTHVGVLIGQQLGEGRVLVVAGDIAQAGLGTVVHESEAPTRWHIGVGLLFLLGLPVAAQIGHTTSTCQQEQDIHQVGHASALAIEGGFVVGNVTTTIIVIFRTRRVLSEVQLAWSAVLRGGFQFCGKGGGNALGEIGEGFLRSIILGSCRAGLRLGIKSVRRCVEIISVVIKLTASVAGSALVSNSVCSAE